MCDNPHFRALADVWLPIAQALHRHDAKNYQGHLTDILGSFSEAIKRVISRKAPYNMHLYLKKLDSVCPRACCTRVLRTPQVFQSGLRWNPGLRCAERFTKFYTALRDFLNFCGVTSQLRYFPLLKAHGWPSDLSKNLKKISVSMSCHVWFIWFRFIYKQINAHG